MTDPILLCPVCRKPLRTEERTVRCANSHAFDVAKEGYINLLLSHQRKSKNPGDDKTMIQARRRFFDSGAFDPVTQKIQSIIGPKRSADNFPEGDSDEGAVHQQSVILDCGCGEGHFLGSLSGHRIGIDVSKEAVRCAAKRYKDVTWIVANGMRKLPIADHSTDVILSVLAPRNIDEFVHILKTDGRLILGVPGPNHLIELRTLLNSNTDDFEEKADEAALKCKPMFTETTRDHLTYKIALNNKQITDLIQMTPIFWNSGTEAKARVQHHHKLDITISLVLITLKSTSRHIKGERE